MSLGSALAIAMSGLRANQSALSIVSSNIANAQTPGYVAEGINQVAVQTGDSGASVIVTGVNRQLDQFIQSQLRTETSGGAYAEGQDQRKGRIAPGLAADLAVLSQDVLTIPAPQLPATTSLLTLVDGEVIFEDAVFASAK